MDLHRMLAFTVMVLAIASVPNTAVLAADRVRPAEHVMGSADAPVIMIEYFSQSCSVCAHFDMTVFPLLKAKYIDTGKVRYVMRLYPLFPIDGPAYKLDRCVASNRFFEAADLLFHHQPEWDNAEYPVPDPHGALIRISQTLGLTPKQADDCMNSTKLDGEINSQAGEADARYNPAGTPTFVIDYVKTDFDPNSWTDIQKALDAALAAKAEKRPN